MAEAEPIASGSGQDEENLLDKEKARLANEILGILDKSGSIWETISSKQAVLHRLYAEQIVVSDKFTEYNTKWRGCDFSDSETTESFEKYLDIDEQVEVLSDILDSFDTKVDKVAGIIKTCVREMKTFTGSVKQSLADVTGASCIKTVESVAIPSLDTLTNVSDADIEALAEEWDRLELDGKISSCLNEVQDLVQPVDQQ